jgi:hypothetical protein
MKKILDICLLTVALNFGVLAVAHAEEAKGGIFVEPSVTFEQGTTVVNYPSPLSDSSGTGTGFGLGARLGFHISEAFFFGLDGRYSMPQYKDSSVEYDAKSVSTNWGPVVGMQMPEIGLRLWGSYILGGILDPAPSGSFDVKFQNATGYRVGAGFRVSSVSLNLEYQQLRYGQTVLEQAGPFASGSPLDDVNLNNKAWLVSVSFPLAL